MSTIITLQGTSEQTAQVLHCLQENGELQRKIHCNLDTSTSIQGLIHLCNLTLHLRYGIGVEANVANLPGLSKSDNIRLTGIQKKCVCPSDFIT